MGYITKACQEIPNQYIRAGTPKNKINSLTERSAGNRLVSALEKPNRAFIQDLKKKVGPRRYKNSKRNIASKGNKSTKNEKKRNSETKKMDPGKPKNIKVFSKAHRKSLGHKKFIPLISVISRVLKRLAIASTNRNELVDSRA